VVSLCDSPISLEFGFIARLHPERVGPKFKHSFLKQALAEPFGSFLDSLSIFFRGKFG
jgi:hypothetical protein